AERGAAIFRENCASCHGADGRGDGSESARLGLAPANFTDPTFRRAETPDDFFNVVTLGRRRSGMPSWGESLSVQDRWDVIRFAWGFAEPVSAVADGATLHQAACGGCHAEPVRDAAALTLRSDADLHAAIGDAATGDRAHARVAGLDDAARWRIVA